MSPPRLLITGFGSFPGMPVNPSAALAKRVAASPRLRRMLGTRPDCLVLRTAYVAIAEELEPALARGPEAVLMIGVAKRARRVRVETRACNRASLLFPDASGAPARQLVLEREGPFLRRSAAASSVLVALGGIGAVASRDAGRYLCNASYFRVLAEGRPAVFLHIPPWPRATRPAVPGARQRRRPLDAWTDAFVEAALTLVRQARRGRPRRVRTDETRAFRSVAEAAE